MTNVQEKNIGFVDGENMKRNYSLLHDSLVDSCSDNTNLDGFFQTEKYFEILLMK